MSDEEKIIALLQKTNDYIKNQAMGRIRNIFNKGISEIWGTIHDVAELYHMKKEYELLKDAEPRYRDELLIRNIKNPIFNVDMDGFESDNEEEMAETLTEREQRKEQEKDKRIKLGKDQPIDNKINDIPTNNPIPNADPIPTDTIKTEMAKEMDGKFNFFMEKLTQSIPLLVKKSIEEQQKHTFNIPETSRPLSIVTNLAGNPSSGSLSRSPESSGSSSTV